ncbi:MAG: hypothetical protein WAM40_09105, partial [Xanthobacteraceae bacterium]
KARDFNPGLCLFAVRLEIMGSAKSATTANVPRTGLFLVPGERHVGRFEVGMNVHEVVIGECADYEIAKPVDAEFIVATAAEAAEPTASAGSDGSRALPGARR